MKKHRLLLVNCWASLDIFAQVSAGKAGLSLTVLLEVNEPCTEGSQSRSRPRKVKAQSTECRQ